jgi:hypothetical protein
MRALTCLLLIAAASAARGEEVVTRTEVEVILPAPEPMLGAALLGGGAGFAGYASQRVQVGGSWGVALTIQPVPLLGLEISYQGAHMRAQGGISPAAINENGAQGLLAFGPRIGDWRLFALGGGAISAFRVGGGSYLAEGGKPIQDGTLYKVPLGGGLAAHIPTSPATEVTVGARATYDFVLNANDVFPDIPSSHRMADQVRVQVEAGARF